MVFGNWKLFKNDEKLFLFHQKAIFKIFKFCLDFLIMYWNDLIKKKSLISNFMTPQSG